MKASNTGSSDYFGFRVAISGDTMVVGAYGESGESGAAYVFVRQGDTWVQQAYLKASNAGLTDLFGTSVAIAGDTIVIGASNEDSDALGVNGSGANDAAPDSGAAYVFVRSGTNWIQQAYLKASNAEAGDEFGVSVTVSGNTIVVGAMREDSVATGVNGSQNNDDGIDSGAAYVFTRNGSIWSQQAYLKASNTSLDDFFGHSAAISGDTIVVGAWREDSSTRGVNGNQNDESSNDSGAAYVFVRSGNSWSQQAYLKSSNSDAQDGFGVAVAVDGNTVVVGALSEDSNARQVNGNQANNSADQAGAAYVFTRNETNWNQQAYLKAANAEAGDAFGQPVGVSGDTIVIGAQTESSGVVGSQWNDTAPFAGAAYVFARAGTNWTQHTYLKASNVAAGDIFGSGVAVSGDTVVVGAYQEDSEATGINGNQSSNDAESSGAAYVFTGAGLGLFPDGLGGWAVRLKQPISQTCTLFRAPEVNGAWTAIETNAANGLGIVSFYDTNAPLTHGFYRTQP